MPNPEKVYKIETPEKTYSLYYGMRALRMFELEARKPISAAFDSQGNVSITDLSILVKVGLLQFHPEITLEQAEDIADEVGIMHILQVVGEAVTKAFSDEKAEGVDEPKNGVLPTVTNVGESP